EERELVPVPLPGRPGEPDRPARPEVVLRALAFFSSARLLAFSPLFLREVEAQPALHPQPRERRPLDVAVEAGEVALVVDPTLLAGRDVALGVRAVEPHLVLERVSLRLRVAEEGVEARGHPPTRALR